MILLKNIGKGLKRRGLLEKYACTGTKRISVVVQNRKKQYAGMLVSNVIRQAGDSEDVYKVAIRYYFSHLRAWLVESPNLKKIAQFKIICYYMRDKASSVFYASETVRIGGGRSI